MKSNVEWKHWGEKDPLYGVAAWEGRDKQGDNPWTDADFYALGEQDWACFKKYWQRYGLRAGSCVEIGCGAGRLTRPMSRFFQHVEALDISESMVAYAKEHLDQSNVVFHVVDGSSIPLDDDSMDCAFSTHVFQHFDTAQDSVPYFREISRVLVPGGTLMIHLPIHAWPVGTGFVIRSLHRLRKWLGYLRATIKRKAIESGKDANIMRITSYETDWIFGLLRALGFGHIEITTFAVESNSSPHSFVFATQMPAGS